MPPVMRISFGERPMHDFRKLFTGSVRGMNIQTYLFYLQEWNR
jgi:hypothetical protein